MVIKFRVETLDYAHVITGGVEPLYPLVRQLRSTFGAQAWSPKNLTFQLGMKPGHRHAPH
jgi:hypothetical protein